MEMWWLIGRDELAHWWRCGGSLVEMWWLIGGDMVSHWWKWGSSLVKIGWLIFGDLMFKRGDVVARWWRRTGSQIEKIYNIRMLSEIPPVIEAIA